VTLSGLLFVQPMPLFAHTRTRRRTAIVMLGSWLLALLVGIANACASGRPDSSHASGEREATMAGHDHDAGASTSSEQARGADESRPLKPACQKFCDEEATTVVKHDKPPKWPHGTHGSGLVPPSPRLCPASLPELRLLRRPLTMRFMRLTI
jgi:hypothetical protein